MNKFKQSLIPLLLGFALLGSGCASWNKTQKGAAVGTATGAAVGGVIGRASGNTAMGAVIGAAVGGTAGAIIGNKMDKQAAEIKKTVPDAKVIRVEEGIVVEFNSGILFGFDKSNVSADAKNRLDQLVNILNEYKDTDIEIQGHTDSRGSEAYNQNLSVERANAVSNYLVNKGIQRNRLTVKGYGELFPKYLNTTAEGRESNRRVEFAITANEKMKADAEKQASN
jgi:outer membrane protein OmpA-like peptidoglycan-associated protein